MEYSSIYTIFILFIYLFLAALVAQKVKHPPAMWETGVQSLGWEDPLEKEKATHSSILAWKSPWTEEPGRSLVGSSVHGVAKRRTRLSNFTFSLYTIFKK